MSTLVITLTAFVGVTALVGAAVMMLRDRTDSKVEDRLASLMSGGESRGNDKNKALPTLLSRPIGTRQGIFERLVERFSKLSLLFEQADTALSPTQFFIISGVLAALGGAMAAAMRSYLLTVPIVAMLLGVLPLCWLVLRRKKRFKKFAAQLPDALELISRALRAGHSLAAGFDLVREEMPSPIGKEFGRVFEEQNLGIPMDEALEGLTERVPNLDVRFFATAVVLQRQTGGDLAEILDKIGSLVRERFKIWGQVQALTGEGRLSGVVLLALPPVLFLAVYKLNREYIMQLFRDPMGIKMLVGSLVMQLLGALVIRKIVNIKV